MNTSLTRAGMAAALVLAAVPLASCESQSTPASSTPASSTPASSTPASSAAHRPMKKGDPELKKVLTPIQFAVTQRDATETPFRNEYWDNHETGLYVDVVSGEPLFSSLDKYDSGTGWPSFTRPLEASNIKSNGGSLYFGIEVRSKAADSHLGHVFNDGPRPAGLRYCMNSAAMRFIPVGRLTAEGYGKYLPLFKGQATAGAR